VDATPDPINSLMYLSPAVLKKNILELLHQKKASYLTTIHFNEQHAQSYWNLAWYLTNLHLPTDFCVLRINNKDKEHRPQASIFAVGQHSPRGYTLASADSRKPKFQPQKWNGKEEPIAGRESASQKVASQKVASQPKARTEKTSSISLTKRFF
jgi:hypothetical protein